MNCHNPVYHIHYETEQVKLNYRDNSQGNFRVR